MTHPAVAYHTRGYAEDYITKPSTSHDQQVTCIKQSTAGAFPLPSVSTGASASIELPSTLAVSHAVQKDLKSSECATIVSRDGQFPSAHNGSVKRQELLVQNASRVQIVSIDEVHLLLKHQSFRPDLGLCINILNSRIPQAVKLALTATSRICDSDLLLATAKMPKTTKIVRCKLDISNCWDAKLIGSVSEIAWVIIVDSTDVLVLRDLCI